MRRFDQKSFGVDVDSKLLDEFTEQYTSRGFKKYRTLEGALRLWLTLSSQEQIQWIEGNPKPVSSDVDVDLDEEIRVFARSFAVLTKKLQDRAAANTQKKPRRKSGTG